jgi:hypothetical protein
MPYTAGGWVGDSLTDREAELLRELHYEALYTLGTIRIAKEEAIKGLEKKGKIRIVASEPFCYVVDVL